MEFMEGWMRVQQGLWTADRGWSGEWNEGANLLLAFGGGNAITNETLWRTMSKRTPSAIVLGCSTGGEIHGTDVLDDSLSVTALSFDNTALKAARETVDKPEFSFEAGLRIGKTLNAPDLRSVFILSDGMTVNGSELVRGVRDAVSANVVVTGGLAGDGARFGTTYVGLNATPTSGCVAAVGFYGDALAIGHGSSGGWDEFGPERIVTSSRGNILFELDGRPALELYKQYLGSYAQDLPGSALFFPLRISPPNHREETLMRTIVGIDEAQKAMIFAGDIPQGHCAQLMRGNMDRLFEGAADAAQQANQARTGDSVAILVSCIGRKLVLGQRTCEEIEAVRDVLGAATPLTGFYSYGEVSPHAVTHVAELHNQTMTVTVLSEGDRA
jgi:hypothetical protein